MKLVVRIGLVLSGILLMMGGIWCLSNPAYTLLSIGWIVGAALILSGIDGIVTTASTNPEEKEKAASYVVSALTVAFGIFMLFNWKMRLMTDFAFLIAFGIWIIFSGVARIGFTFSSGLSGWRRVLSLILGVFLTVIGIYSFMHPTVLASTLVWVIGFYVFSTGFNIMVYGFASPAGVIKA